jgi:7-cyano-7-deazaguanine synthase in queuosine biosynthesis
LGERPLSPRALDLIDLSGAIYRLESQIPRRPTNPVKEWEVVAPVRDVAFWSSAGGTLLAAVLRFLNRAQWTFTFENRARCEKIAYAPSPRAVREIVLFSGGMDSACGAGIHPPPRDRVQLVSSYINQRTLQQTLAAELGYQPPTQWRLTGRRGKEGMDLIRAFMFISLGAAVAESFGASTVYQYENGVLAMAVPPSGSQVPTRHAHPEFHRRMERLCAAAFGRAIEIRNPFLLLTKREEASEFAKIAGDDLAESILRRTQTCWRLSQAHVGGLKKPPFVPCGVCTPCIVRRTARPFEAKKGAWKDWPGYAFDPRKPAVRNHKIGTSFRAYLELVGTALTAPGDREMIEDLAPEARALIDGEAGPRADQAAQLLRRFAHEFCEAFDIPVPTESL